MNTMQERISKGLDPLTGDEMKTVGKIFMSGNRFFDGSLKEVTLNSKGTWVYK